MSYFKQQALNIKSELIDIRRKLHENPELGMEEYETSKLIKTFLKKEGINFVEVAKTGVCGIIEGTKEGQDLKTIALRADMDALPIEEKNSCIYSSKVNGKMHACGHDAHTAILLGCAKLLNKNRNLFSGNVKLLFEPAEETIGGSKIMIQEGVLENPKVDAILGLHVEETVECGKVMVKKGVVNASSNPFKIIIKGSGGHGAYPHTTIDPIVIASNIILSLQTIVSREINPNNKAVVTVGTIHGGTAQNVIPEEVILTGIIRTMFKEDREYIKKRLTEIVSGICKASRANCSIEIEDSYPSLYNDNFMVELFKNVSDNILGRENIIVQENPKMGVESFAYFANERPCVFYFLGSSNKDKGIIYPAHSSLFDIDEDCLTIGVAIQCELVLQYLTRREFNINL
ncbi:M20 metallopeptidase family protein [Clostridium chauvoei]|uniref:Amidohydrolase n=2 Tax=Clostridium chauvoei TaxID=46867 RepID=A0ABD4RFQ0_9CLOT|nr:amidohydrolase [Clostridium chauvoei]ATD55653.1 peptidase M20 [Clostridium chauvoei]ATD56669.1 peptidase M20 [Clostridium chauvoei]MBX7280109.1 amidohydrolase [Clostridium chauvoei]MBX7282593.1 amidohydrolase [Clostridium chauvoei]MBX7285000.1 amidohydrolase [Clostridium chauvoei]